MRNEGGVDVVLSVGAKQNDDRKPKTCLTNPHSSPSQVNADVALPMHIYIHPSISSRIRAYVLSDIDPLRSPSQQETDPVSP
jgi:hypothetical protein